jgi:hypothetical protein
MFLFVVNNRDAHIPINSVDRAGGEIIVDLRSFSNESKSVALFNKFSQFGGMGGREF